VTSLILGIAPSAARAVLTPILGPDLAAETIRRRPEWARTPQTWRNPTILSAAAGEMYIYRPVADAPGCVSSEAFARDLAAHDGEPVTVRVNSPGGDVHEGIAIYNALNRYKGRITVHVDGLAASAASFLIMAADEIVVGRHSELMIHEAHGVAIGPAEEMITMAAILEKVSENIASIYAERAGGKASEWRERMRAETWYSDREAVAAGLADRIDGAEAPVAAQEPLMRWDAFAHVTTWNGRLVKTALAVAQTADSPAGWRQLGADLGDLWRRPQVLAESLGFPVISVAMGSLDTPGRRVLARTVMPPFVARPRVLLAQQDYDGEERALAHELGHVLQGSHDCGEAEEERCEAFSTGWMAGKGKYQ
jgi:ATP-dependent protease ClpP protease subunit